MLLQTGTTLISAEANQNPIEARQWYVIREHKTAVVVVGQV
jgi:hypothetical protein